MSGLLDLLGKYLISSLGVSVSFFHFCVKKVWNIFLNDDRSQQEKKHVMLFKIVKTSCDEEIDAHPLEVASARLKVMKFLESHDFSDLDLLFY